MTKEELKQMMKACGITKEELAESLCVSVHTVTKWLNGQRKISPAMEKLIKLVYFK